MDSKDTARSRPRGRGQREKRESISCAVEPPESELGQHDLFTNPDFHVTTILHERSPDPGTTGGPPPSATGDAVNVGLLLHGRNAPGATRASLTAAVASSAVAARAVASETRTRQASDRASAAELVPPAGEGRRRPGRGDPVGCSPSGKPWSARSLTTRTLPLSTPAAAPLVAGRAPDRGLRRRAPARSRSHAVADAPSAPATSQVRTRLSSPWRKSPLHSSGDASRLTALLLGQICPISRLVRRAPRRYCSSNSPW